MSIEEALERVPREAESSKAQKGRESWELIKKRSSFGSSYRKKALEAGRYIHKEAGVPELLEDLAEHIRPVFSDVKIEEKLMPNGTVSSKIVWKSIGILEKPYGDGYNFVEIIACPLTKDLVVEGRGEFEVFSKYQWGSDPKLLEDAIVRAYNSSIRTAGPSGRT